MAVCKNESIAFLWPPFMCADVYIFFKRDYLLWLRLLSFFYEFISKIKMNSQCVKNPSFISFEDHYVD